MNYTTLGSLKDKLWITDTSSDSKLLLIIEKATKLIDSKIWYNLKKEVVKRIDGTWTNKLFLDNKPNEIIYIKNKNSTYFYTLDYTDNYIVYLEEKSQKWSKNIEISYSIWFDTVPSDIENICMELAVALESWFMN